MKQKKIIFIHLLNDYSGSPKVLSQVISAVQKNGCDVELYTGKSKDGFLSGLTDKHHHYFYKRFENKYLTLVTFMLSQVILFFKLLKHRNEDVLIYVNTMLPFGAGIAGKVMGKAVYYHVHEIYLQPASFKRLLRTVIQKTASKIIFVSKYVKESETFLNKEETVLYNVLSSSFRHIAVNSSYEHIGDKNFNVLMICSLKAYKGLNEFIDIAFKCENEQKMTFTLVLNATRLEIDLYFKDKELPANILLVPRQENVIPFYEQASLLMNLSQVDEAIETFGLTIIEAMAFGIPVIVPPVGGPAEIVSNGVEGYLISSYETENIAKTIINLSKDEERCMRLSNAARKRSEDFKEDVFEKKMIKVLCE